MSPTDAFPRVCRVRASRGGPRTSAVRSAGVPRFQKWLSCIDVIEDLAEDNEGISWHHFKSSVAYAYARSADVVGRVEDLKSLMVALAEKLPVLRRGLESSEQRWPDPWLSDAQKVTLELEGGRDGHQAHGYARSNDLKARGPRRSKPPECFVRRTSLR